ncbi:hypothetical protein H0H81_010999, partial [Sphagnurus paluster]
DTVVPPAYLQELRKHVLLYPDDTNYRVTLEPGRGYGRITCLEKGCNSTVIPLIDRINKPDGGIREGLGSLSAYRCHIAEHPTHAHNRNERIRMAHTIDQPAPKLPPKSRLLDVLDNRVLDSAPSTLVTRTEVSAISNPFMRCSSLVRIKMEPSENNPYVPDSSSVASSFVPQTPSAHRFRQAAKTSNLVAIKPEAPEAQVPRKRSSEDVFSPSTSDALEESGSSIHKRLKTEENSLRQGFFRLGFGAGSSNTVAAGPPSVDLEGIRLKITETQAQISHYEGMINRLLCKNTLSKADKTRLLRYKEIVSNLRESKNEYTTSIPNASPIRRALSRSSVFAALPSQGTSGSIPQVSYTHPPEPRPFEAKREQPVASGSKMPLPSAYHRHEYEADVYEDPARLPNAVLQSIGPIVPDIGALRNADAFDDNGDFYGRGRDTFVGPQAKADDIDKFLLEAGNAAQFDGNARVDQALDKLGLQSQYDLLPGMEVALMPHQTIGVAWMVEKERGFLKGGCLGDDMGLGKTIQMIATLVKNRSENPMCKTNLIIAPTALLDQWKLEIEMKTNCGLQCLIYHGSSKPKRKQDLLKYDIVLTTYSTMALEWPDFENEQKKKIKTKRKKAQDFIIDDSDEGRAKSKKKELGLLFQVEFYRVILDEAQAIRNRRTRTSRAITSLETTYRWCLTGTPIINSLGDAYGYLRFLKIRPWYDFKEFQGHIATLAVTRLQAVLSTFLLRRMKDSKLDGRNLIELPNKTVSLIRLHFTQEEREIYTMVETNAQANFNRYLRAGTVLKNYSQVLVLLLRLRQICSHPSLIQEGAAAFISPHEVLEDDEEPYSGRELARASHLVSPEFVTKMKAKFKASTLQRMEAEKASMDAAVDDEECPICFDALTDAVITPCTHIFCRECLVEVINAPLAVGADEPNKYQAHERPCPACRSAICTEKLFTRDAFLPSDADLLGVGHIGVKTEDTASPPDRKGKGKAKAKRVHRESDAIGSESESEDEDCEDGLSDFIAEDDEDEEQTDTRRKRVKRLGKRRANVIIDSEDEIEESPEQEEILFGKKVRMSPEASKLMPRFLPSTKMKYMMEYLTKLTEERPEEKTLVVSQWTGCLSLVSDYLAEKGVIHVKYQGDMNRVKRDQAVRAFMSRDKARVMLMSLKCGGVGLNLTRANNVICLDLGWSQAIEAQSFDRLGQTRPVAVQRLVISNTVEDRVLAMQERKQLLADGSLGEGTGKKIGRLSVRELANLFGLDHRGRVLAA